MGKEVDGIEDSVIFRSLQALAVPLIGNACHIFMHGLNSVQVLCWRALLILESILFHLSKQGILADLWCRETSAGITGET